MDDLLRLYDDTMLLRLLHSYRRSVSVLRPVRDRLSVRRDSYGKRMYSEHCAMLALCEQNILVIEREFTRREELGDD